MALSGSTKVWKDFPFLCAKFTSLSFLLHGLSWVYNSHLPECASVAETHSQFFFHYVVPQL